MYLSVFIVSLQGLGIFRFNVTNIHIENGSANFNLPQNISLTDICTMRGVIVGGNDAGNSTTADIQLPSGMFGRGTLIPHYLIHCLIWTLFTHDSYLLQSVALHHPVDQQ